MGKLTSPPERIETKRLLLRAWRPDDAARLKAAIDESLDHLHPWMVWADQEPETLNAKRRRIKHMQEQFEAGEDFAYGTCKLDESVVLGACGLHARIGAGGSELGYWIHVDHINQGYASEAAAALTRVGLEQLGAGRIEIHCHPANSASVAVPRKLGFELISEDKEQMVWRLKQSVGSRL